MNPLAFLRRLIENFQRWRQNNPVYGEQLRAWVRLLFLLFSWPAVALLGIWLFEDSHPIITAIQMGQNDPIAQLFPTWLVVFWVPFTKWQYARYLIAPLGGFLLIFLGGVIYVKDIYGLEALRPAFRYIFSSMFGLFYKTLEIDGGVTRIPEGKINTVREIGGPGFARIQPGNAVIFRHLREPSRVSLPSLYFLRPFETLGPIADLNDQHDYRDSVWAATLDGIQLHLRDINYRYRLLPAVQNGLPQPRTVQDPYPFSEDAMRDMAYNLSAGDTWQAAVRRIVVGEITDLISKNRIDYLTAPRREGQNPRYELRMKLFAEGIRGRLRKIGTELLWIDVGHLDIMDISDVKSENVDGQRFEYWASRWIGAVNRMHAFGEADRLAMQERGRVEAQAELLRNITEALRGFEQTADPAENLRRMLLVRTAQILEGMREAGVRKEEKE